MKMLVALFLGLVVSGCSPDLGDRCTDQADCPTGSYCSYFEGEGWCIKVDEGDVEDGHRTTDGSMPNADSTPRDAEADVATDASVIEADATRPPPLDGTTLADAHPVSDGEVRDSSPRPDSTPPPPADAIPPIMDGTTDAATADAGTRLDSSVPSDAAEPELDATADAGCQDGAPCIVPCVPSDEVCNNLDDDCDGQIDDGVLNACGECGPVPDEVCDGQDNNCDGAMDEGCECNSAVFNPIDITCGRGICANTGQTICEQGHIVNLCEENSRPSEDDTTCDLIDDDCDGTADDDFVTGTSNCGTGICVRTGQFLCHEGDIISTCQPGTPGPAEDCNTPVDDNCNGQVNEGCGPPPDAAVDAALPPLDAATEADATPPDADLPPLDASVMDGGVPPTDASLPDAGLPPETCNNADDDGDGLTDESEDGLPLTQPCYEGPPNTEGVGLCQGGTTTCVLGTWSACVGQILPEEEIPLVCNNLDDDCDGSVDEDAPDGDNDGWSLCEDCNDEEDRVHPDHLEVCDSLDNNCSGRYNEGLVGCLCQDRDHDRIPDCGTTGGSAVDPMTIPADGTAMRDCDDQSAGHGAVPGQSCIPLP